MVSVAGGWFALMAVRDVHLGRPGLPAAGAGQLYLQTAADAGEYAGDAERDR